MFNIKPGVLHYVILNDETPVAQVPYYYPDVAERIIRCVNAADEATRLLIEAQAKIKATDPELAKKIGECVRKLTK